jgi:NAD(P)H-flavin reductase
VIKAPRIAKAALPGQFLIIRDDEQGERIPLTISDSDPVKGMVTVVIQLIGASSHKMVEQFEAGDSYANVVGPLGNPSDFVHMSPEELKEHRYVFIAGGLGTAPVYPQAKWLYEHGVAVDVIIGARMKELLIYTEELASVCDNLYLCTDDGSVGFKGVGTAKLEALAAEGKKYTRCVAIGPMIMMKFASLTCRKLNIPIMVSMNSLMVDGTGMCGACRVSVGGQTKFSCVDGPEFDGALIDWDEAMRRSRQYQPEEAASMERYGK